MMRLVSCLLVSACAPTAPLPADATSSPPEVSSAVKIAWAGQDVVGDPTDSRVPRTLVGPMKPCPNVVGDDVVKVMIEVIIGTGSAYVGDATVDCADGHTTIPVPAGSGTFNVTVITSLNYSWLAADAPITTIGGQTAYAKVNLNNQIPTSGGGGDGGDGDDNGGIFGF